MFPDALEKRKRAAEGGDEEEEMEMDLSATTAVDIVRRETTDTTNTTTTTSSSCSNSVVAKLSLDQIKSLPKVLVSMLQCSGNRRGGFNGLRQTSETPWGQGAISTAKWGGARLIDVLMLAMEQVEEKNKLSTKKNENDGKEGLIVIGTLHSLQALINDHPELQHLRFESLDLDGMLASMQTRVRPIRRCNSHLRNEW